MRLMPMAEGTGFVCWDLDGKTPAQTLQIQMDGIRDTPYGLFGLCTCSHQDMSFTFGPWRIGLQDLRSQRDFLLEIAKLDGALPWGRALREFCQWIVSEYGRGDAAAYLDPRPEPAHSYLITPFLPLDDPTIIYGDGGSGKSLLALGMALTYTTGHPVVPGLGFLEPGKCLYLDFERNEEKMGQQLGRLMRGAGITTRGELKYIRLYRALPDQIDHLRGQCAQFDPQLVIVDSKGFASGGEIERSEATFRFFRSLATLRRTILILDHVAISQRESSGTRRPYGSIYSRNAAFMTWDLRAQDHVTDGDAPYGFTIVIRRDKPGFDRKYAASAYRVTFPAQMVTFESCPVPEDESGGAGNGKDTLTDKLLRWGLREAFTVGAAADLYGTGVTKEEKRRDQDRIRALLNKLKARGKMTAVETMGTIMWRTVREEELNGEEGSTTDDPAGGAEGV
jgi:hypothetical protein